MMTVIEANGLIEFGTERGVARVKERKNERKKDRKMRSDTEYRTYGKQRLAEAGVARSLSPDQSAS